MTFNLSEQQEKKYLQQVIGIINDTIQNTDTSVKEHVETLQEYKDYIWSNKDIDPHEIRSMRESILNHFALGESVIDKRRRLGKILDIPYFGRIDFEEKKNGSSVLPIYIGIHTFYDSQSKTNLIYDWRAPISGMFYDYELGKAVYTSPTGEISGDISLKRQYRIRKGKMEYMIESSLTVHDEILQKEFSSNADDKMKNIVTTIQREQNRIIRNEEAHVLIIQGVAGSGKTSIALHRIAYLLYTLKGNISSKDILIISPNKVFGDYISNVLPELGEESVPETSMEQILSGVLENKYKYQNFFEQVTELLEKTSSDFIERIKYKSSFEFISQLDKFILYMENNYFKAAEVKLTRHITIPAEYIEEQFRRFNRYPMRQRSEAMTDYILEMMKVQYYFTITTSEKNLLKKEIKKMFAGNNDLQIYKEFFVWIGKPELFKLRKNRMLEYADLAPLAYLHLALDGNIASPGVKHLLIDEMQDYSRLQYLILKMMFPCRMTILGDKAQTMEDEAQDVLGFLPKIFGKEIRRIVMNKSYRNTVEIASYANQLAGITDMDLFDRHGQPVEELFFKGKKQQAMEAALDELVNKLQLGAEQFETAALILRTESEAKEAARILKEKLENTGFDIENRFSYLHRDSTSFCKGLTVTTFYLAKGLEFDQVFSLFPAADQSPIAKQGRYIAATRALHKLHMYEYGK